MQQHGGWKNAQSNYKLLQKIAFSSYHIECKKFTKASYANSIRTGEKVLLRLLRLKACEAFLS